MYLKKHEKEIIKKIATGEVKDIPSYLKAFNLSTFHKLDKHEIQKKLELDEDGKTYKKYKLEPNSFNLETVYKEVKSRSNNDLGHLTKGEADYELVTATVCYEDSKYIVDANEKEQFIYDYFKGLNICNSFSYIKTFLMIWQFLKSEGLVLEVDKKVTSEDYEPFFEYKPIEETAYYKARKLMENTPEKNDYIGIITSGFSIGGKINRDAIKDYRYYIDSLFEYNKSHELICTQFINKQIYGTPDLDIYIKKRFKTNEQRNITKALVPSYAALVLTLGIAIYQQVIVDDTDIVKVQNQLNEIEKKMDEEEEFISSIERDLEMIIYNSSSGEKEKELDEIIKEMNDNIGN